MALKHHIGSAYMISMHNIPDGLKIEIPSVYPGRYIIPSIESDPDQIGRECFFNLSDFLTRQEVPWQYARIMRSKTFGKYVLLSIPDSITLRIGTEKQEFDEFANELVPNISRTRLPMLASEVANELERQLKAFGVMTIEGKEPTDEEMKDAHHKAAQWRLRFFNDANHNVLTTGILEATPLAVFIANYLFHNSAIPELPEWAAMQVQENTPFSPQMRTCPNCLGVQNERAARCLKCSAVLDWKRAVELGLVTPENVPLTKRTEAGLAVATK